MNHLSARDAKNAFGLLIDMARADKIGREVRSLTEMHDKRLRQGRCMATPHEGVLC